MNKKRSARAGSIVIAVAALLALTAGTAVAQSAQVQGRHHWSRRKHHDVADCGCGERGRACLTDTTRRAADVSGAFQARKKADGRDCTGPGSCSAGAGHQQRPEPAGGQPGSGSTARACKPRRTFRPGCSGRAAEGSSRSRTDRSSRRSWPQQQAALKASSRQQALTKRRSLPTRPPSPRSTSASASWTSTTSGMKSRCTSPTARSRLIRSTTPKLLALCQKAKTVTGYIIQVKGYASAVGTAALNQKLSEERANNVTNILEQQGGIPLTNMLAPGAMGDSRQVGSRQDRRRTGGEPSRRGSGTAEQGHRRHRDAVAVPSKTIER